jgi:hypothetical protein
VRRRACAAVAAPGLRLRACAIARSLRPAAHVIPCALTQYDRASRASVRARGGGVGAAVVCGRGGAARRRGRRGVVGGAARRAVVARGRRGVRSWRVGAQLSASPAGMFAGAQRWARMLLPGARSLRSTAHVIPCAVDRSVRAGGTVRSSAARAPGGTVRARRKRAAAEPRGPGESARPAELCAPGESARPHRARLAAIDAGAALR